MAAGIMRTSLRRDRLADQVAQYLLALIEEQSLLPGDYLPSEAKLTQEFGVSRPIVREALRSLEARGIIEIANGKGARVKPIGGDVIRDFFSSAIRRKPEILVELLELRRGVEIQSAFLAAQRRTDDDLTQMVDILEIMSQYLFDVDKYTALDADLHLLIARASCNSLLYHLIESIREPLQDTIRAGYNLGTVADKENLLPTHKGIVMAVQRGDARAAARAMERHFDGAIVRLMQDLGSNSAR